MILQDMKDLLLFLPGLKRLELIDLELDGHDGKWYYERILNYYKLPCLLSLQPLTFWMR